MTSLKIDKGIPMPPKHAKPSWVSNMEIGDSVLCESWSKSHAIYQALVRQGKTVTCRQEEGGVRVWRIT